MSGSVSRRALFGGAWQGKPAPVRPPWTPPEADFTDRCTGCGDCIPACPPKILIKGRAGYPVVDFSRGACDFCGACAEACPESLFAVRESTPWNIKARVNTDCLSIAGVTCRVCAEWCDARAVRFQLEVGGRARPEINDGACTGCGECVAVCPVKAITMEECE
ncbi:MAG: ferredoxin-type protein NapF [Alphaproteobacteria bacterium]|nr:ferredoxin-type protein NapF [Alphaproteobacteria bacterium]